MRASAAWVAAAAILGCSARPPALPAPVVPTMPASAVTVAAPERDYLVFVASEAVDQIALIRFGPGGARVERRRETGLNPADPDGPHGVAVSPDGRYYYVTTAHGTPNGYLWKYATADDALVGRVELGAFPASVQVSPDGLYVIAVNFNLHGDMEPSSVSIVAANEMLEVARLTTCTMPHGSRFNRQGTRHYSTCMMDEMLIEIDPRTFEVARHFMLTRGQEHGMAGAPGRRGGAGQGGAAGMGGGHGMDAVPAGSAKCSPTWAVSSRDGGSVFVACNGSGEIVEVDVAGWRVRRRLAAGDGVYNLAVTHDGRRIVATNKRGRSVSVIDLATGVEEVRIPTLRTVVHGVAISDDDRYAFVSVEGYGAEPGTVEVIDLRGLRRVASVDVGQMAGGIEFWKSEPAR